MFPQDSAVIRTANFRKGGSVIVGITRTPSAYPRQTRKAGGARSCLRQGVTVLSADAKRTINDSQGTLGADPCQWNYHFDQRSKLDIGESILGRSRAESLIGFHRARI